MKVMVIGNGGHSKVIQEMIMRQGKYKVHAIVDDKFEIEEVVDGIVYAPMTSIQRLLDKEIKVVVAIGSNTVRKRVVNKLNLPIEQYLTVIDPSVIISKSAVLGHGTVVMPKSVINADARIGDHCIINTGAITEHDSMVKDYAHISPNVTLTGNVLVREGVHIGAGATIIPGVIIGEWSIIGAGATVIQSIPPYSKAVGTPARIINKVIGVVKEIM